MKQLTMLAAAGMMTCLLTACGSDTPPPAPEMDADKATMQAPPPPPAGATMGAPTAAPTAAPASDEASATDTVADADADTQSSE